MKREKKQKKKARKRNYDSLTDSEHYDTIDELPGYEAQQPAGGAYAKYAGKGGLSRAMSHSPRSFKQPQKPSSKAVIHDLRQGAPPTLSRNNTFKTIAPKIMHKQSGQHFQAPIKPVKPVATFSNSSTRPIRSGAFQRINSKTFR